MRRSRKAEQSVPPPPKSSNEDLNRARVCVKQARECLRSEISLAVIRLNEALEFCIQASLHHIGKQHDGPQPATNVLVANIAQFPAHFRSKVGRIITIKETLELLSLRARSGDQVLGLPPSLLFQPPEVQGYINAAQDLLVDFEALLAERAVDLTDVGSVPNVDFLNT